MKNRSETMKYKRIVFKVGTSSLTNEDGSLSRSKVKAITQQLAMLHEAGHELILVSSGAIAAGFGALGFKKRPTKIADKQASAAVGQGLLLEEYTTNLLLRQIVSAQILLTQDDFVDKRRYKMPIRLCQFYLAVERFLSSTRMTVSSLMSSRSGTMTL